MPRSDDRDVAEAIARIARDLQDLQEGNDPDGDLAVARDESETATAEDAIAGTRDLSDDDRFLHTLTASKVEDIKNNNNTPPANKMGLAEMHE